MDSILNSEGVDEKILYLSKRYDSDVIASHVYGNIIKLYVEDTNTEYLYAVHTDGLHQVSKKKCKN